MYMYTSKCKVEQSKSATLNKQEQNVYSMPGGVCVMLKHWFCLMRKIRKLLDGFLLLQQFIDLCLNVSFLSGKLFESELEK